MQTNKKSWYSVRMAAEDHAEVMIYDEIGQFGIGAKQFAEDFAAIKSPRITLRINSAGGDVFDGFAIYQAIRQHSAETVVQIDGLAASIASIIALAGKSVTMAENAYMMIHLPWTWAMGNANEMRKQADLLEKLGGTSADIYAKKTGKKPEEMLDLMASETWFSAEEAKEAGLIDTIIDGDEEVIPATVAAAMMKFNPPEKLKKIAASLIQRGAEEAGAERRQREEAEKKRLAELTARELEVCAKKAKGV